AKKDGAAWLAGRPVLIVQSRRRACGVVWMRLVVVLVAVAVGVTVLEFLGQGRPYAEDLDLEMERLAGQPVIGIDDDAVGADLGNESLHLLAGLFVDQIER